MTNYTYRLEDISDPERLLSTFQTYKRRNIKKAQNSGLQFKFDLPADTFYNFHKECLKKRGREISYSKQLFHQMHDAAYCHQGGRVAYVTDSQENLLSTVFVLMDSYWAYYLIPAWNPDARNTGAQDFLVFELLKYFSDKVIGYDFEGSMIEGVEESYRSFGAKQTPYFSIHKTYTKNPILRAAIATKPR